MKSLRIIFPLIILVMLSTGELRSQTVVIANSSVQSTKLSIEDLMDIYTLNKTHWDDGSRVSVYYVKDGKAKEDFLSYLDMSEDNLKRIWLRKQFTGKAPPPNAMESEEELIEEVAKTKGAIGFASERAVRGKKKIRIVARVKK
ncbi:substrate-binding domain-containing protein [bacterium]|nr:substrate-binding domain-containing protein [bacterium]